MASASDPSPPLPNVKSRAKVEVRFLSHTDEQRAATATVYENSQHTCYTYCSGNSPAQQDARRLLTSLGLDSYSRAKLESRWSVQWSTSWPVQSGKDWRRRLLFQCLCGYAQDARRTREQGKRDSSSNDSRSKPGTRRVAYDFTGCLAHVEITERESDGEVTRITGIFEHNNSCVDSLLKRLPAVPLHDHVYQVALQQLECGASLSAIQERNRDFINRRLYHDMASYDPSTANIRYHFLPTDHVTLYRKFSRKVGIDVRKEPQYNIDDWLNPKSPEFKPEISEAIFHYTARTNAAERFQVCISTPDMDTAAWKYGHCSQLILDGTFGVCSARLLLFIAMVVDEHRKGVPVAFFLFSAPTGNRATHAGYNTAILRELLTHWKEHLGSNSRNEYFLVHVAITDTDTKEPGALLDVWPAICLLICKFHLRQCWTNHRKKLLRSGAKGDFWKDHVRNQLRGLEEELISSVDHGTAISLIERCRAVMTGLASFSEASSIAAGNGGIQHLDYLIANWMPLAMWRSWSDHGRLAASALLKIPVEGVLPTTNHLESFNAILKRKHLRAWLHSGHRLRFDSLILVLITRILPGIYDHRKAQRAYIDWLATRFSQHAGGVDLTARHRHLADVQQPLCWWYPDEARDRQATMIVSLKRISPARDAQPGSYSASCLSSKSIATGSDTTCYEIKIHEVGIASCKCPDFHTHGGACKHLRAMRMILDVWVHYGHIPSLNYPTSSEAAREIMKTNNISPVSLPIHLPSPLRDSSPPPVPILKQNIDWTLIQGLSDDTTTIDDLEDPTMQDFASDASDSESDSGAIVHDHITAASTARESFAPPSHTGQRAAVMDQIQRRIEHDITQLLPHLHGLDTLIHDIDAVEDSPSIQEFTTILCSITHGLEKVGMNSDASANVPRLPEAVHAPSNAPTSSNRKWPRLLQPSPERRQSRRDSHAPL
ncbi:hypothetical protein FPV67DRAFT_1456570 [Lyophyllum atratum]|nr:hypothetical protein FPV67DRAFT_1456570 [Lyophyllum atratum]